MTKAIYFCVLAALGLILIGQVSVIPATLGGLWGIVWLTLVWRYNKQKITPMPKLFLVAFTLLSVTFRSGCCVFNHLFICQESGV